MQDQPSPKTAREVTILKLLCLLVGALRMLVLKFLVVLETRLLVSMLSIRLDVVIGICKKLAALLNDISPIGDVNGYN